MRHRWAFLLLLGCGSRTQIEGGDASVADAWSCGNPDPLSNGTWCGGEVQQQACRVWARSLVRTGYVHATCVVGGLVCLACDVSVSEYFDSCVCNLETQERCEYFSGAGPGEICVSDTPDSAPHCVKPCSR